MWSKTSDLHRDSASQMRCVAITLRSRYFLAGSLLPHTLLLHVKLALRADCTNLSCVICATGMVGETGLEPMTSWSQTTCATNCATPRYSYIYYSTICAPIALTLVYRITRGSCAGIEPTITAFLQRYIHPCMLTRT